MWKALFKPVADYDPNEPLFTGEIGTYTNLTIHEGKPEMPAKTEKQARFMRACAHKPDQMDKKCPPKSVARDFMHTPKKTKPRSRG